MLIETNSIQLYYEKTGAGRPIILLHGNGQNHNIFNELIRSLSKKYTCYAIDSRNHGKSQVSSNLHYSDMMEDIVEFITKLNIEKPFLYGFSDGGVVGLMIASTHQSMLARLAVSGTNTTPDGVLAKAKRFAQRMYDYTKDEKYKLILMEPHISISDLHRIKVPTMVTIGSKDIVRPYFARALARNISKSKLFIFQNETHSSYVKHTAMLSPYLQDFFVDEEFEPTK